MQNFFCNFCCVLEENGVYCGPDFRKRRHSYEASNAFAPAGINGLATMLQYLLHINIGYLSLLINLPLVLLAWKKVDRDFARKTLVFVLVFSAVTLVLGQMDLSAIAYDSGSSAILGPVAAGVVSGAVYGWVIRQNGSTGGTDIVATWVRKKHPEASLVWLIFSLNAAVAVLSFFVYGCQFEPVILCLIYCYLSSSISDTILKGGRHEIRGGHPAAGGALPAAHAAAAPRCHCAPGGGNVLGDSPFPADLRGEPPSGGSVPGDSGPLPGYLRLRLQCQ